jgi:hypothetical protein
MVLLRPHIQTRQFVSFNHRILLANPQRVEVCVSNMPSVEAKKLSKLSQEKVLLELRSRLANSIPPFLETYLSGLTIFAIPRILHPLFYLR